MAFVGYGYGRCGRTQMPVCVLQCEVESQTEYYISYREQRDHCTDIPSTRVRHISPCLKAGGVWRFSDKVRQVRLLRNGRRV